MQKRLTPATIMASAAIGVIAAALVMAMGALVKTALMPASGGVIALAAIGSDSMSGPGWTGLSTNLAAGAGNVDADCFVCFSTSEGFVLDDETADPAPPIEIVAAPPEPSADDPDDVDVAPIEEPDTSGDDGAEETNPDETEGEQDPDPETGEPEPTPEPIADPEPDDVTDEDPQDDSTDDDPKDDDLEEDDPKTDDPETGGPQKDDPKGPKDPKDDSSDENSPGACQRAPVDLPPGLCPDGDVLGVELPLLDF